MDSLFLAMKQNSIKRLDRCFTVFFLKLGKFSFDLFRNNKRSFFHVFLFSSFSISLLFSQDPYLQPTKWLSISEGLAHNGVTSIVEDSRGYLWIGTYDGLNRYDGYGIKTFKNTVGKKIFASNRIRTINEDEEGHLWIGTDEGISIYDCDQQKFKNIYSNQLTNKQLSGPIIRKIIFSTKHEIAICATEGFGLLVFGKDFSFKNQYLPPNEDSRKPILFFDGIQLDEDYFLFSTSKGMLLFDIESKKFISILKEKIQFSKAVIRTGDGSLVVTRTEGFSILKYEKRNGQYSFQWKGDGLNDYQLTSAGVDSLGNLWLGTLLDGVVRIENFSHEISLNHHQTNSFYDKKYFDLKSGMLRVSCFYFSKKTGEWVGTFNNGLYEFDLKENPFKSYNIEMELPFGLTSNRILSVSSYDDDRILLSANRGGLALFNTIGQGFEPLPFVIPNSLENRVGKVFVDSRENIWMWHSDNYGMSRVRKESQYIERIKYPSLPELNDLSLRYITEDNDGNIWIGAVEGVYKILLDSVGEIKKIISINDNSYFIKNNKIVNARYIYMDEKHDDLLWIGTQTEGLFRIKLGDDDQLDDAIFQQFLSDEELVNTLPSNFVSCILRIPDGSLWLGTERGGICQVKKEGGELTFETYSENQGLSNNVVKAILYDNGSLWVPTNIGLNKFDLHEKRFQNFRKSDGLPFENFEYYSEILENGIIVLSSANGFCYFDPEDLKDNESLPSLIFGDFKLFSSPVLPNDSIDGRVILERALNNTSKISLKHDESVFTIQVKSLHYSNSDNFYLRYQLLPINEDWITISSDQEDISFNGLPPDDYTLRVQASNSKGDWTGLRELEIIIEAPYWKTGWAYLLYSLVLLGMIGAIFFVVLRIQNLNHIVTIEKIEIDNIKERNASKLRFFSNISHEIKTPIALISGPVDMLLQRFRGNNEIEDNLELIKRQSKKINELVEQVHDFQKADANALKINNTHFSFGDFIDVLVSDFYFMAGREEKHLVLSRGDDPLYVYADKNKLEKIFNNLLSNAFKYSDGGDTITFSYEQENNNIIVTVQDTGRGISTVDLPLIFERFYQSGNNSTNVGGAGIGLAFSKKLVDMHFGSIGAESEMYKGSKFTVTLPIIKPMPSLEKIEKEEKVLKEEGEFIITQFLDRKVELSTIKLDADYTETIIFVAEDNHDLRSFVERVLSKFFKVRTFSNGKQCWEAIASDWPDLVVSDVLMPEMNGFELCRKIKSDIKTSHIPVMLLTACSSIEDQIEGLEVGADNYVKKPFDIQHLVLSIAALLKSRAQLRERFQIDFPVGLEKSHHSEKDEVFLDKLFEIMELNLDNQEVELDNFAKTLYLNRTHFYQKVKALTNETPYELMKEFRLKKAAELLVKKDYSVSQVYSMTGFKSRTHFSKLFKEKYAISPGKYGK